VNADQYSISQYWENGFAVINGLIPENKIDAFMGKYKPKHVVLGKEKTSYETYIERNEYLRSQEILEMLCGDEVSSVVSHLNKYFALHISEARIGTSGTDWHTDYLEKNAIGANGYIGVHIAMSDVDEGCGPFQLIPKSHKWLKNSEIINWENCKSNPQQCCEYNNELIKTKGIEPFVFIPHKGDVLIWHGNLMHRGSPADEWAKGRDVLFGHYRAMEKNEIEAIEKNKPSSRLGKHKSMFYVISGNNG
jgi:hypothetical protein